MARVPEYVITKAVHFGQEASLPEGSFVKPIEACYLPKHITDSDAFRYVNLKDNVYVYCHYGIIPIPRSILRQV